MTAVLTAAVVVLAALTAVCLLMLAAVVRRLRTIEERLNGPAATLPEVGLTVAGFQAADLTATPLNESDVEDGTVLFVMPGCGPCADLIAALAEHPSGALTAFVAGNPADEVTQELARKVGAVADRVAVVDEGGAVTAAFGGVSSFPTVLRISGGVIAAAGRSVDAVAPTLVAA
ncbi:MAG: hypothetical protein HOV71_25400 [Hamadaea sp.]|nr:hypothetical protein [Hamadaea sp.]NUR51475.1 hypothetical protein [Hamadaea sp.]NUT05997.1 hypothetical protein [Hamadaea sp.]